VRQKNSGFKYMEKSPCSDFKVPIWWDFVKKMVTIKPIGWYLDTIHTLVVRVWRIGFRVICGGCACFGKHNSRPHLRSHRYPQVKLSCKGLNHTQPSPKPLQHDTLLAPPSQVEWPRARPQGLSNSGLNFESRTSWGPGVPVHWAITPGPGVLAFVSKFLQFDGSVLQPPDHVLFSVSLIFEWVPWQPFYFVYLFVFSSNSMPWARTLIVCNIWLRTCVAIIFSPASPQLETNCFWFMMCFLPPYSYFNFMLDA
jgi:hypothetical protein